MVHRLPLLIGVLALLFSAAGFTTLTDPALQAQAADSLQAETSSLPSQTLAIVLMVLGLIAAAGVAFFGWREQLRKRRNTRMENLVAEHTESLNRMARKVYGPQKPRRDVRLTRDKLAEPFRQRTPVPRRSTNDSPFQLPGAPPRPKVLVIEPDESFRARMLAELGRRYLTHGLPDINEGIAAARFMQPALVVCGVSEDRHEVVAFCKTLKQTSGLDHIPILLLAEKDLEVDTQVRFSAAADDSMFHALHAREVLMHAENLIEVRRYLRQGGFQKVTLSGDDTTARLADALLLESLHTAVEQNMSNRLFGIEQLADAAGITLQQLEHSMYRLTRLSSAGFIRTKRLLYALELVRRGQLSTAQIAREAGFHNEETFSRLFRQTYGAEAAGA